MNMRVGGLATGMDIDMVVKQLMQVERMPLDKLFQKRQILEWQRDAYREVNLSLSKFRDAYSKLRLQSTFNSYSVTSSNTSAVVSKATASAIPGNYQVKVHQLARSASVVSTAPIQAQSASSNFAGTGTVWKTASKTLTIAASEISAGDHLVIDGKKIEFYDGRNGAAPGTEPGTIYVNLYDEEDQLLSNSNLASKIVEALGESQHVSITSSLGRITVTAKTSGEAGNSLVDVTVSSEGVKVTNSVDGSNSSTIVLTAVPQSGSKFTIEGLESGSYQIHFYDSSKNGQPDDSAQLSIDTANKSLNEVLSELVSKLNQAPVLNDHQLEFHQEGNGFSITAPNENIQTRYSANAKAGDRVLGSNEDEKTFTIRTALGEAEIRVTKDDTFSSLAQKISNAFVEIDGKKVSLGLKANFDNTTSRFFISSKEMGSDQWFEFDGDIAFVNSRILGRDEAATDPLRINGQDAHITYMNASGQEIVINDLKSNNVTINGIELTLLAVTPEDQPITLTVSSDPEAVFNTIKDFVEKYNELIDELRAKINEPRYRDYPPLTNEQKAELSDKEIELWEEKAKSGMLRNDAILTRVLNELRRAIYDPVAGIAANELNQISKIGITTGNYMNGGKLEINEERLRAAILEDPDGVMNLFTKSSEAEGNSPVDRTELGIGKRIYAVLNDTITALRDKAGTPGFTSGDQSQLGKTIYGLNDEIRAWEDRLTRIENRYWSQFTAMEKAINQMNQQSLWLQQNLLSNMGY